MLAIRQDRRSTLVAIVMRIPRTHQLNSGDVQQALVWQPDGHYVNSA
jgi:hypothetical protein